MIRLVRFRKKLAGRLDIFTFIVGFAIGAGILGLPIKFGTTGTGFIPSIVMLFVAFFFQITTAIYLVEGMEVLGAEEFPRLVGKGLGRWASIISFSFIFLYLCGAMTAYLTFGGVAINSLTRGIVPIFVGILLYWSFGTYITIAGKKALSSAENAMVMGILGLLVVNVILCFTNPHASIKNLEWGNWANIFSVFGIILFAFAIHAAIPTAYRTFGGGREYPRYLVLGLGVSALIYLVWSASYMSIIPKDAYTATFVGALTGKVYHGLKGLPAPVAVAELGILKIAAYLGYIFGFLTTFTSFIAASHSLAEINKNYLPIKSRPFVYSLTLIPPLFLGLSKIASFTDWLNFAGAVGAGIFTGILPCLLAIKLRIRRPEGFKPLMPGGIPLAIVTLIFYAIGISWYLMHPL